MNFLKERLERILGYLTSGYKWTTSDVVKNALLASLGLIQGPSSVPPGSASTAFANRHVPLNLSSERAEWPSISGDTRFDVPLSVYQLELCQTIREAKRVHPAIMYRAILALCAEHFLTLRQLADLLGRHHETLRTHYVNQLIEQGLLQCRVPESKKHPCQAYKAVQENTAPEDALASRPESNHQYHNN